MRRHAAAPIGGRRSTIGRLRRPATVKRSAARSHNDSVRFMLQFVLSRWSMKRTLSLWDLAALRFTVAGLLSLPIVLRRPPIGAAAWRRIAVLSIAAGAPYTLIMYAGLTHAPAAHGAVIITGATPLVAGLLAWMWLGERQHASRAFGLAL